MSPPAFDLRELDRCGEFRELVSALHAGPTGDEISVGGLWGASQALVLAAAVQRAQGPWLVLASSDIEAESTAADLAALGAEPLLFPARETQTSRGRGPARAQREGSHGLAHVDLEAVRDRLQVAQRLAGPPERRPRLLVASLLSMLQPVPSPDQIEGEFLHLQLGAKLDTEDLLERLVASGYARQPLAEAPGEVSLRGDILDLYPFAADLPLRVELFDDEIESLRTFDPGDQRSVESVSRVALCIASDAGGVEDGRGAQPATLLAPTAIWVRVEPLRIADQAEGLRIRSSSHARALSELDQRSRRHPRVALQSLPGEHIQFETRSVQALSVGMKQAPEALREAVDQGARVHVLCRTAAEEHRFGELLDEAGGVPGVATSVGSISVGFRLPALDLVLINHRELAGVLGARAAPRQRPQHRVKALQSFFELRPGDLVVHAVHGVALFKGLERLPRRGGEEEHLHLIFADEVTLLVPAARIDLVQRYIGSGSKAPPLDKLGSSSFRKRKEKVERALVDLAAELLEVQALRETHNRPPWPADDELVRDMLGAFPYTPTTDQAVADGEIRADLSRERPLDRLLCGDVGFGKTEVAVRAAFRVVNGGAQVAVLVPTTVLADQHYRTFSARLADFPVEVACLSRYTGGKKMREQIERISRGQVDIVIGTHRILSKDVNLPRLGLVVIDEEQRFGVKHKEHFKQLRATVDVLTLSATPIPRTLHMSLSGLRDISALSVAPEGRQDIETLLGYCEDDELIRDALLREKNRGGQVFFLHNRVQTIEAVAAHLRRLLPECSFAVGHGQMPGRLLSLVMDSFTRGDIDVLVATTIIENGIDIPTAGTIVIDRADRYGLSELHQLRGRVGRGRHKSYCYLLVEESRPLSQVARERLKALEEMSHLGAGFQISMKDLEIRGAGNILGPQQSGHIAAVGYDMYCRLLRKTTERLQAAGTPGTPGSPARGEGVEPAEVELELGLVAYLPEHWIPTPAARLELLRRLDAVHSETEAEEVAAMMRDRYGRLPIEAQRLVRLFCLRASLAAAGITRLSWRDDTYLLEFRDRVALEGALGGADRGLELRPLRAGQALLVVPPEARSPEKACTWLEELLRGASPLPMMRGAGEEP